MQVTDKDLKDSFTLLVFVDPANYKNAVDNVRRLQDITELAGPLAPQQGSRRTLLSLQAQKWHPHKSHPADKKHPR